MRLVSYTHLIAFQEQFVVLLEELPGHVTTLGINGYGDYNENRVLGTYLSLMNE